jgi:hypothetical protein
MTASCRPGRTALLPALVVVLSLGAGSLNAGEDPALPDDEAVVIELPLAARGEGPDGTLFERLPARRTGLDFVHRFEPEDRHLHVLGNAMAGGGVAVGDVDGDGLPELLLTRPHGGSRLYRNLGDLRFEDMSVAAGLLPDRWGGGASLSDLDGDGDLDLVVCGYEVPNRLYWNQGDGTYLEGAAAAGLAFSGASITFAVADHDLDGDLDGYLLTNSFAERDAPAEGLPVVDGRVVVPEARREQADLLTRPDGSTVLITAGQYDHLYRNEGDRTFADVSAAAGIEGNHFGLSATWWDPDVDGWPDLYVANDFFGPDKLYDNQGDGTFVDVAPSALPHTPWFSMGSDAADVDGDGLIDLFGSDMAGTTHARRMVTMTDLPEARWFLDAAVPRQYVRNALYLNTGTERFAEVAMLAGVARSDWTWSTVFGDLDADGRQDLFISNGMTRDYFHYDLRTGASQHGSIMDDFWIDQEPLAEANIAFRNAGGLRFDSVGPEWGLDHVAVSFGAALADLDRDGDLDVVCNDFEGPVALFENRSAEGHVLSLELAGAGGNTSAVGARVTVITRDPAGAEGRQVRELFPSRGYMTGLEPRLHFGLGDHAEVLAVEVSWPGGGHQRVEGLSVDRAYRIRQTTVAGAPFPAPAGWGPSAEEPLFRAIDGPVVGEMAYDDFARQPLLPARLSGLGPPLACGDVNGDGRDDLFVGGPGGQSGQVLRTVEGNLTGDVPEALLYDDYHEDMGSLLFDVDGDGDQDLYVASGSIEGRAGSSVLRDRLYLNDGAGSFKRAPSSALPKRKESASSLAAADVDGDGDLDLYVGARSVPGRWPEGGESALLRNDAGSFVDASEELAPGLAAQGRVTGARFSDVDGDGDADLMVAHEWGPVRLWRNTAGVLSDDTAGAGLVSHTGWWNSMTVGDPDGDGDLDGVAGNLGWASRTRPAPGQPAVLFFGDLDGSGVEVVAETSWRDGVLVPGRPRNDVLGALPFLEAGFGDWEAWGEATLEEVFDPALLEAATRLEATTADTSLLRNDGAGRFAFEALPVEAQVSPVFGATFLELDGDGLPDLVLAQNSYAPQSEHGRLDGGLGLALLGDGAGGFTALRADRSGVVVPGDGKSLVVTDLDDDGWPDVVVGQNDGPLRILLRRGARSGRMLAVRLAGPSGNPTGVGASITLKRAGQPSQTVELAAGSGYLSQSAPVAWFGLGPALGPEAIAAESEPDAAGSPAEAASEVEVRWPDGRTTTHAVAPGASSITLRAD